MIVIGLDGMEWNIIFQIGREKLPTFFHIIDNWKWDTLWVDGIPHTAPSWTTIWTGASNEEHGIQDFEHFDSEGNKLHRHTPDEIKQAFVWERLYRTGMKVAAFDIYCTLPPTHYYTDYKTSLEFSLTLTLEEMGLAMIAQRNKLKQLVENGINFVAFTNIVPDKAHHIMSKEKKDMEYLEKVYSMIDSWLLDCLEICSQHTIAILSDHGRPGPAWVHSHGGKTPAHISNGIIACNRYVPPTKTEKVADWLLQISTEEFSNQLSREEEKILEERLKALGYLE